MERMDVEGFVNRDWRALARSKRAYWAARKRRLGAAEGLRAAEELRRFATAARPDWPSDTDRAADLEAHARLSRLLRDAHRHR